MSRFLARSSEALVTVVPRHGVVTLFGYGISVCMDRGHLYIEDGIGPDRRRVRLSRVRHGLKRLVVIGSDGFVSLAALRWLADQDAAFVMLERNGKLLAVTGPVRPSDVRLRRAQALAHQSGIALQIAKELIRTKLTGQETLVRSKLNQSTAADAIAQFRERLSACETIEAVRTVEAHAAIDYWCAWRDVPVLFPKADRQRVPEHWRFFGTRASPLTGSPRLAVTPPGAILNYCYALLESESRLAAAALGLDPGMGMLHVDTPKRDSLACDIMEAVRPSVDAWLLDWITKESLRRSDFFEERNGNCRLMATLAAKLSETTRTWGRLVAPWAECVAKTLWATTRHPNTRNVIATPLTQQHRREAKDRPPFSPVEVPRPDHNCQGCGKQIPRGKKYCQSCAVPLTRHNFDLGRKVAQSPKFLAKRSLTQQQHKQAIRDWNSSGLPSCLTREVYLKQIQPKLTGVTKSSIRKALGVSEPYSSYVQQGKRIPHPRHWKALGQLVGITRNLG